MSQFDQRLKKLGITLPEVEPALGNFLPYRISRSQVFIAGQVSIIAGERITGKLGGDLSVEDGYRGSRLCGLNILAQLKAALKDDIDRARAVELSGFVNAVPEFTQIPAVMNGVSDLLIEVLGEEKGSHARSSAGVSSLPVGAAVGVKALFEVE